MSKIESKRSIASLPPEAIAAEKHAAEWRAWKRRALAAEAERDRLRKLFDDAGQGEHNVLALVDHYQQEASDNAHAAAKHAQQHRILRTAHRQAVDEVGRLRDAYREILRAVEVAEMALRSDVLPDGDTDVRGWARRKLADALIATGDTRAALASSLTVEVVEGAGHDCDGVACATCADRHIAAMEAKAEATQPTDKPDAIPPCARCGKDPRDRGPCTPNASGGEDASGYDFAKWDAAPVGTCSECDEPRRVLEVSPGRVMCEDCDVRTEVLL